MIAKLICWAETRDEAITKTQRSLTEFILTGIKSNIVLLKSILDHEMFRDGSYTTQFIEKSFQVEEPELFKDIDDDIFLIAAAITAYNDRKSKDVRQLNLVSRWKNMGRKMQLRV
jgi:acetyl-CoA carboxylase biotin carboxylase subunit